MLRLALLGLVLAGCASAPSAPSPNVLVYTHTNGYVHASIPDGVAAIVEIGAEHGFSVSATDDSLVFAPERLAVYDAVVFLNTTGDVLAPAQEDALGAFVEDGGGFVGVHAAGDTEYDSPVYQRLQRAFFESHPATQEATIDVVETDHPATRHLPARWTRTDEWYNFKTVPDGVTVLLRLDESTYQGGTMGDDHPIAWSHRVGDGRMLYTALGHTAESYAEGEFRAHLAGAICWAADLACGR